MEPIVEPLIRRLRLRQAKKHFPKDRNGTWLDIGCGLRAIFLKETKFTNKIGIETDEGNFVSVPDNIKLIKGDVTKSSLPIKDNSVDVVTCIALIEHIDDDKIPYLLGEIRRVLKENGKFIMTAPMHKTEKVIKLLANLRLTSQEEMEEHKCTYNPNKIINLLKDLNFKNINLGYFELGLN